MDTLPAMVPPFVPGIVLAFVASLPISGPVAALVVALAIGGRRREALAVAAGASLVEGTYAGIAYAGIAAALATRPGLSHTLGLVGAGLVVAVGLFVAWGRLPTMATKPARAGSFFVGMSIMLLNVTVILQWSAVVAAITPWVRAGHDAALSFGVGVGAGAFLGLATAAWIVMRLRFSPERTRLVTRVCGVWLAALGLWMAWRVLAA